jgi:hypothetical protein
MAASAAVHQMPVSVIVSRRRRANEGDRREHPARKGETAPSIWFRTALI